jgi:23S rRNA (adenine2503-C2)-methyltransferase
MTLCISSQVGCALACAFCATGTMGLTRNLTPGEIAGQVALAVRVLKETPYPGHAHLLEDRERPVTNVVYMGMGEPLHNYDDVLKSLRILTDEEGLGFSPKKITVSTVGMVPQMLALGEAIPVTLAVSLHAPNEKIRGEIMPINKKYRLSDVMDACRKFPLKARARITFEYVMLAGVNDSIANAEELARVIDSLPCKVNLIPWNEHAGAAFKRPSKAAVDAFARRLEELGVTCMVRTTRGRDIAAACGQLALTAPGASKETATS